MNIKRVIDLEQKIKRPIRYVGSFQVDTRIFQAPCYNINE